ncbi:MAG: fliA [Verrucomicrobiales bacterium]|jgi:RNA polymerase sigma factor for flagellar operon FliA|nr:fliA [Verrucomicrobiales bacterium]
MIATPIADTITLASETQLGQTELWRRYQTTGHGNSAEEELVKKYLHLVKTVVGKIAMNLPAHVDLDDLQSAGMIGLLNAVRHYKPEVGSPFEAYARLRIRGEVLDELRRMDWVPRSVHVKARKVQAAMERLEPQAGGMPPDDAMAATLQIPVAEYRKWLLEIRPTTFVTLDTISGMDGDDESGERHAVADDSNFPPSFSVSQRELARLIAERIQQLPDLYQKILALYYYEDLRVKEIAQVCGFSESHICQVHSKAILAIKSHIETQEARRMQHRNRLVA